MTARIAPGLLAIALAAAIGAAAGPARGADLVVTRDLVVLDYNVKALPIVTDLDRLKRIGEIFAERRAAGDAPDVVLLQECYMGKARRIRDRAGYPYQLLGDGQGGGVGLFENPSGLEILSNYPIVATSQRRFGDCAFPDCIIAKGVLGAAIRVPGVPFPIEIYNTHLQADTRNDPERRNQIDDLETYFWRIGFGRRPAIFGGDFNFKPRHPSYHKFLRVLPFQDVGADCLAAPDRCALELTGRTDESDVWRSNHDRQFTYVPEQVGPGGYRVEIRPERVIRNFTEPYRGEPLSDHWGFEVRYRIRWWREQPLRAAASSDPALQRVTR